MPNELLKKQLALTLIPGIGSVLAKTLLKHCGSAEQVFNEKKSRLEKITGIGSVLASSIVKSKEAMILADKEVAFMQRQGIRTLFYTDDSFPPRLRHCNDGPVMLFVKGTSALHAPRVVSIVGTRSATDYGKKLCRQLVEAMQGKGMLIASGLAYGIDICAHKAALQHDIENVAVLGSSIDRIYPDLHASVAEKIMDNGALVSEYVSNTGPEKENFPKRNRIIAGLADAVIVVEAARKGGALITAEIANAYQRDVFAFPGDVDNKYSQGCNMLIKTNKAQLAESYNDIEYIMGWMEKAVKKKTIQFPLFTEMDADEKSVYTIICNHPSCSIDTLCMHVSMPSSKVSLILFQLEMKNLIKALPGNMYKAN